MRVLRWWPLWWRVQRAGRRHADSGNSGEGPEKGVKPVGGEQQTQTRKEKNRRVLKAEIYANNKLKKLFLRNIIKVSYFPLKSTSSKFISSLFLLPSSSVFRFDFVLSWTKIRTKSRCKKAEQKKIKEMQQHMIAINTVKYI